MVEKNFINTQEYDDLVDEMLKMVNVKDYNGVFGVPKNGSIVAISVSFKTGLKLLDKPVKGCLVVDDLIDTGETMKSYKGFDFKVLIDKRNLKNGKWVDWWFEKKDEGIEDNITRIFEYIGENPTREGVKDTPQRIRKMYEEIFKGYDELKKPDITVFPNGQDGLRYDEMIFDTGIFHSFCEHHMLPFFGNYYFAYVPLDKVVGLSKVARIVDYCGSKLQIQERLVKEVLDELEKKLEPLGIGLVIKATHMCKSIRGVKKEGQMITSDMRGVFRNDMKAREEFLDLIKIHNGR